MRRTVSWIMILGILGLLARWLAVVTEPAELQASTQEPASQLSLAGPYLREVGPEGLRMAVTAATATYDQKEDTAHAYQVHAHVYRNAATSVVTSDEARYDAALETARLTGNVRIKSDQGYTLETTSAVYHHRTELITAAGLFHAEGNGVLLEGYGLEYDLQADRFLVERNVGATILGLKP